MIKLPKPTNLNGDELRQELRSNNIEISDDLDSLIDNGEGFLFVNVNETFEQIVSEVVKNHNGNIVPKEPTVADKLASVGLSIEDLKDALGL